MKRIPHSRFNFFHLCVDFPFSKLLSTGHGSRDDMEKSFWFCVLRRALSGHGRLWLHWQSFRRLQSTFTLCSHGRHVHSVLGGGDGFGFYRRLHCHNANESSRCCSRFFHSLDFFNFILKSFSGAQDNRLHGNAARAAGFSVRSFARLACRMVTFMHSEHCIQMMFYLHIFSILSLLCIIIPIWKGCCGGKVKTRCAPWTIK